MKVLVFEFMTGGGASDQHPFDESQIEFLRQGASMLEPIVEDFAAAGHEVTVLCDAKLKQNLKLPASTKTIEVAEESDLEAALVRAAERNEAVLLIAPESEGCLAGVAQWLAPFANKLIGPSREFIQLTGDKWLCWKHLRNANVPTPMTWRCDSTEDVGEIYALAITGQVQWPLVVKPIDGAGSENVSLVHSEIDLEDLRSREIDKPFLLQQYIDGDAVSIACIGAKDGLVEFLEPGFQIFDAKPFGVHQSTRLPLPILLSGRAIALARLTVSALPQFRGYIGIDMVLGKEPANDAIIEVNPRLTTSYKYLRQFHPFNLADRMLR